MLNQIPKKFLNKFTDKQTTNKQTKDKENKKLEQVHSYIRTSIDKMKGKQERLMKKHNFGHPDNKLMLYPERNAFYMYNSKTNKVFFQAKFQSIGTHSEKSNTWRWGWSNRFVPNDLKKTSLKIKAFGEANKINILSQPKIKDKNMGYIFTALGMSLSNSQGYYIVPGTRVYPNIFIIFTKIEKVTLDYAEVVKKIRSNSRSNSNLFRKKLKMIPKKPVNKKTKVKSKVKVESKVKVKSKVKVEAKVKVESPIKKKVKKVKKTKSVKVKVTKKKATTTNKKNVPVKKHVVKTIPVIVKTKTKRRLKEKNNSSNLYNKQIIRTLRVIPNKNNNSGIVNNSIKIKKIKNNVSNSGL